ncbi:hypothetical protein PR202_gb02364 [Eleusine coracana subsp. coracana]|uniref:Uncharacterized protein n=1 Tax=Eleusine coracana subsp. coracana TaxID=191504 RepID=A0AAV5DZ26_ELECO|nr:hypothetical protein PR202_gb02364 [Eleusine coracana subsp. coracana]
MQVTPRSLAPGVRIFSPFPQSLARAVRARAHGGWREVLCVQAGIEACAGGKSRVTAPRFAPSAPFFSTRARVTKEEAGRTSVSAAHPGLDSRLRFDAAAAAEGMAAEASAAAEIKPFAVLFACLCEYPQSQPLPLGFVSVSVPVCANY